MDHEARYPRSARLLSRGDFEAVFKQAFRSGDACFSVLARRKEEGEARLGLAISKKASGNGVQRNRIKRVVRESFRLRRHELPPLDIVVLARPAIGQRPNRELRQSIDRHWTQLIARCNES